jgi:DNA invertase Pin-like site-specific DNA recombinase
MSDAQQRYSIETQKEIISAYAEREGYEIIATYADEAKSGVTLRGRDGLKTLIRDVLGGPAFEAVLVTDVTRWGRFQDPDEAAHYEFLCRRAGVPIVYCAEVFDNSGGQASAILKSVKRVMAAEYSRQLSARTRAAVRRTLATGHCGGGPAPFGFAKEIVDEATGQVRLLQPGQRKQRSSERLRFVWGPPEEVATLRFIFRAYGRDGLTVMEIVKALRAQGQAFRENLPWTTHRVTQILDTELAIGLFAFGKSENVFGVRTKIRERKDWSRVRVLKPMISAALFARARARREACRKRTFTDEELIQDLERLIRSHGVVTHHIVAAWGIVSPLIYVRRFGSLGTALRKAGQIGRVRGGAKWEGEALQWERVEPALRQLLAEQGFLSRSLINACPYVPRAPTLIRHFGNLEDIYRRVGDMTTRSQKAELAWATRSRRFPHAETAAALPTHLRRPRVRPPRSELLCSEAAFIEPSWLARARRGDDG